MSFSVHLRAHGLVHELISFSWKILAYIFEISCSFAVSLTVSTRIVSALYSGFVEAYSPGGTEMYGRGWGGVGLIESAPDARVRYMLFPPSGDFYHELSLAMEVHGNIPKNKIFLSFYI